MTYFGIFNSPLLYGLVIVAIAFIFIYSLITFVTAYKHAQELGYKKEELKEITRGALVFTIVPSISIVIGLITLSAVIGVPWSWFRLSVVGAVTYELMAADMTATGAGYDSIGALAQTGDPSLVATIMFVMSFCIVCGVLCTLFFNKGFNGAISKMSKTGPVGALIVSSLLLALTVNIPLQVSKGPVYIATMITSAVISLICRVLAKKTGQKWLSNFEMALCLILGMASSLVWVKVFGA